jgi:hypothetical protein
MYEHREPEGDNIRFLVILGLVVGVAVPLLLGFNEWFGVVAAYVLVPPVIATPFVITGSILSKEPAFRIASFVTLTWFVIVFAGLLVTGSFDIAFGCRGCGWPFSVSNWAPVAALIAAAGTFWHWLRA